MCNCELNCVPDYLIAGTRAILGPVTEGDIYRRYKSNQLPITRENMMNRFRPDTDSWNCSKLSNPVDVLLSEIESNCEGPYFQVNGYDGIVVNVSKLLSYMQNAPVPDTQYTLYDLAEIAHARTTCNYAHCEFRFIDQTNKTKLTKSLIREALFRSITSQTVC